MDLIWSAVSANKVDFGNENQYHLYYTFRYSEVRVPKLRPLLNAVFIGGLLIATPAFAVDPDFTLTIKDHRFEPTELQVPAGRKITLLVKNLDPTAEEFESHELKREKVVPGKSEVTITLGPLKPGIYKFFGDFHESTAKGSIVAK
jgi:plastocyanin